MPVSHKRFARLTDTARSTRSGWRSYKRFRNRDTLGAKVFSFFVPHPTLKNVTGPLLAIAAAAVLFFWLRAHPDSARRLIGSPNQSTQASSGAQPGTGKSSASQPSARSPSPNPGLGPPTGYPTVPAAGVPPTSLSGPAVTFLNHYYTQSAADKPADRRVLLARYAPARLVSKLNVMVAAQGDKTTPVVDVANMNSQSLGHGKVYITAPVAITVIDPNGDVSHKLTNSRSVWQSHGSGWTLVFYSDKESASGR